MNPIRRWWRNHGTKITGYTTSAVGVIAVSDPKLVTDVFGQTWGERIFRWCLLAAGIITAIRGHQNTKRAQQESTV